MYEPNYPDTGTKRPPGVVLYPSFYDALKDLPEETVGRLMLALMRYVIYGEEPTFDPLLMVAWSFLKTYADHDRQRYAEAVQRRKAAAEKRWRGNTPQPAPTSAAPPKAAAEKDATAKKEAAAQKEAATEKAPVTVDTASYVRYDPPAAAGQQPKAISPLPKTDEPTASPEWVREHIFKGENGKFLEGWAKRMYPELRENK